VARGNFLKIGHFAQFFFNFYTLRVEIFRMFFIRSRLPMTRMNDEKFHGNRSARFLRNPEDTQTDMQTDRRGNFI